MIDHNESFEERVKGMLLDEVARVMIDGDNTGEPRGILNVEGVSVAEVGTQRGMLQHAFVFYSLTPGRCGYGPNRDELCGAMRSAHPPLAERRQAILDALWEFELPAGTRRERMAERATRVRLTPEIIEAAGAMKYAPGAATARAVLEAAGFEVVE